MGSISRRKPCGVSDWLAPGQPLAAACSAERSRGLQQSTRAAARVEVSVV